MIRLITLTAILSSAVGAADKAPAAAKAAPTLSRTSGRIVKSAARGSKASAQGQITLADDAGHLEDFRVDGQTRVTCDGQKSAWAKSAVPNVCDRAARVLYDPQTKRVHLLELKSALKADADDAKTRPNVSGEVAVTDVIGGKISVRLGGGSMIDFKVGEGVKILREADGKAAEDAAFESIKVGELVEVRSKDWKNADEIHVRAAAH